MKLCWFLWQSHGNELVTPRRISKGRLQWVQRVSAHSYWFCMCSITDSVCVSGCSWKQMAYLSVQSPAWCLKHRSGFSCDTQSCPGPSLARSSGTPGSSLGRSLTWTQSTRMRPSSSPFSFLTLSAWLVRIHIKAISGLCILCSIYDC